MTTVLKCGGADDIDLAAVAVGVAALRATGERVVLAHGGAREISRLAAELGVAERTLTNPAGVTSRYTDDALLDVVTMALLGRVTPRVVVALAAAGVQAAGLSGVVRARAKTRRAVVGGRTVVVRDDRSGRIAAVDTAALEALLDAGVVPVVAPPALGVAGGLLNVDADRAAAAVAAALGAQRLVLLTAAPGVLADPDDPGSLLPELTVGRDGTADGVGVAGAGMLRKLVAAAEALRGGVREVRVADGRGTDPVGAALGGGTQIVLGEEHDG